MDPVFIRHKHYFVRPISNSSIRLHLSRLRQFANNRTGFIRDTHARRPDLIERVVHGSGSRVGKASILPAQHDSDVGGKVLVSAVDIVAVHDPDSDRDLSWPIS